MLGYTCGFLDGPLTDKLITSTYREQVSACGYGCMTAINYNKSGKAFVVTATTFPVFDSICATGRDSDQSSLTHIATIFSNILDIETAFGNSEQLALAHVQRSNQPLFKSEAFVQQPKIAQGGPRRSQGRGHGSGGPGSGQGQGQGLEHRGHGHVHKRTRSTASESCGEAQHAGGGSRRSPSPGLLNGEFTQSSHRAPESEIVHQQDQGNTHELTQADFVKIGQSARLADILRIMIVCKNPMVMTDSSGKILHLNRTWTEFCGYNLQDIEGLDNNVLQGPDTDMAEVGKCMSEVHRGNVGTMNVVNYKKNGSAYRATVMIIPLQGGYLNPGKPSARPSLPLRLLSALPSLVSFLPPQSRPPTHYPATTHFYACLWPENECA